ncbi:PrsW family intramembrane metalloprotease [Aeromicrobium sp. PE09-221]|uniref:PrsW family intramembrane metalloprotease n=1 Tax=Aeromicrobium sp. PE09-221 TaxID=1898043 RepID=UPI000B3ED701|nr:PrsW family intramembrane metalloprotease [Aeromicrobium sp. PE09-221]
MTVYTPPAPPRSRYRPQRGRLVLVVLTWITAVLGAVAAVFFAAQAGDVPGATLAIVFALLPLPLVLWAYWWLDRVEPEPFRYKGAAFVWGAVVAVAISLALESAASIWLDVSDEVLTAVVAPVVEESAKGLFLVLTLLRARRIIDGVLDGLIVSGLVAIGFAAVENIGYYAISYLGIGDGPQQLAGPGGATATFVVRGLFSPFAHPLFTSAIGIAMGLAVGRRSRAVRILLMVGGLLASIALHALWNGSLVIGGGVGFLLVYLVLAALLVGLGVLAIVLRQGQLATLWKSLSYAASHRGWLHPAEVPFLVSFSRRRAARTYAKIHRGKRGAQAVGEYQRLATRLGFLHDQVMRGKAPADGVDRVYAVLDAMDAIRPQVLLPPALPPGMR